MSNPDNDSDVRTEGDRKIQRITIIYIFKQIRLIQVTKRKT